MSLMNRYSDIYGIDFKEVKQWINDYANGNVPDSVKEWIEPTKEERIESIKSYIQRMVDESLTSQVKSSIQSERIEKSIPKKADLCPF